MASPRGEFRSRLGFILAAAGSAVGALALTLPIELAAGALLSTRPIVIRALGALVALAQLCRFGPLWYAVGNWRMSFVAT